MLKLVVWDSKYVNSPAMNQRWFALVLLLSCLHTALAQDAWKLAKEQKEVRVFTRTNPDSPIKEYRAETDVDVPIDEVVSFFMRTNIHPTWMEGVASVRRVSGTEELLYYELDIPFPFKNRCMWLNETTESHPDKFVLHLVTAPGIIPEGLVPLESVHGFWEFVKISGSRTRVRQQFATDPGGAMPDWLVNLFIVKNPYKTMRNMRSSLGY